MEWNFGAKVVPTSIEAQYLELHASNYLLSSNESWSIYALTFVAVFYFNCFFEFYNSIYEYLKLYKIVTNKSKLFVYIVVCLLHWNKTVFDENLSSDTPSRLRVQYTAKNKVFGDLGLQQSQLRRPFRQRSDEHFECI